MSEPTAAIQSIAQRRHDWLAERGRWASVSVDFGPGGYYQKHRVVWHVPGAWLTEEGQSFEEAVDKAMKRDAAHGANDSA